jgi:hypothetical protein
VVVRAVDPATRRRLFERLGVEEMANLRSFLDKPKTRGTTLKGSGQIGFVLHTKNHQKQVVSDGTDLKEQVLMALYIICAFLHNMQIHTYPKMYTHHCTSHHSPQIDEMQLRYGRDPAIYNYSRAAIVHGRISINGRFWGKWTVFDYMKRNARGPMRLCVGLVKDFVVVEYTHKDIERKRGRVRQNTLKGTLVFVRAKQYNPNPVREANMWVARAKPNYHLRTQAVCLKDLCAFLTDAPERNGRVGFVNLVKVATAFVL